MENENLLQLLKLHLQISNNAFDGLLTHLLGASKTMITNEGITLDLDDYADISILVMYAGWLYQKRDAGEGMPRALRYNLNNRLMRQKGAKDA